MPRRSNGEVDRTEDRSTSIGGVRISRAFVCQRRSVEQRSAVHIAPNRPTIERRRPRPSERHPPRLVASAARKGVCHESHTSIRGHESRGAEKAFIKSAAARVAAGRDTLDDTPSARGASSTAADVPLRQRRATTRRARPPRRRASRRATARLWRATTAKATMTTTTSARSTSSRSATRTSRSPRRDSMIYIYIYIYIGF